MQFHYTNYCVESIFIALVFWPYIYKNSRSCLKNGHLHNDQLIINLEISQKRKWKFATFAYAIYPVGWDKFSVPKKNIETSNTDEK
jgi:hypothetical protein